MGVKAVYFSRTFIFSSCLPMSCWPACWLLLLRDPTTAATMGMEVTEVTATVDTDMAVMAMDILPMMVMGTVTIMDMAIMDMGMDTAMEDTDPSTRGALITSRCT